MKQNLWALYYKKSKTTTNLRTAQEQILNESRLRNQMNDRMDPLVANEGGIEAITLIIFLWIGNGKVHEDSEWWSTMRTQQSTIVWIH